MGEHIEGQPALARLKELVQDIDICMMTTLNEKGLFRSRPMSNNGDVSEDGTMYFFTSEDTHKVHQIEERPLVELTFADVKASKYISVCGNARLITDKSILEQHWKPSLKAWFPNGLDEPGVAMLEITLESAEYWETPGSFVSHSLSFIKSMVTSRPFDPSVHGSVHT